MITLISWTTWKSWREFKSESREINKNSFLGMLKLKSLLAINWCYQIGIWNYAPAEMSQSFSFKIQLTWVFFKATREQSETRSKRQKFAGAMQRQLNVIFMFEEMLSLGYEMERSENKNYGMKGVTIGNIDTAKDKLKLLLKKCSKSITCRNFSLYPSDLFLSHRGENHQFITFSKHMYIQHRHITLLFREVKDTTCVEQLYNWNYFRKD